MLTSAKSALSYPTPNTLPKIQQMKTLPKEFYVHAPNEFCREAVINHAQALGYERHGWEEYYSNFIFEPYGGRNVFYDCFNNFGKEKLELETFFAAAPSPKEFKFTLGKYPGVATKEYVRVGCEKLSIEEYKKYIKRVETLLDSPGKQLPDKWFIYTGNEVISAEIQKKLFELGLSWVESGNKVIDLDFSCIVYNLYGRKSLTYESSYEVAAEGYKFGKEIHLSDLFNAAPNTIPSGPLKYETVINGDNMTISDNSFPVAEFKEVVAKINQFLA